MTEEQQLSALLRIKRYEQPPSGYYQKLLADVHRRQRSELLRQPLWRIALERAQTFFGEHSLGNLSYAGAMAAVAIAGLALLGVSLPNFGTQSGTVTAAHRDASTVEPLPKPALVAAETRATDAGGDVSHFLSLDGSTAVVSAEVTREIPSNVRLLPTPSKAPVVVRAPRYVIDARPASYEASAVSFNF